MYACLRLLRILSYTEKIDLFNFEIPPYSFILHTTFLAYKHINAHLFLNINMQSISLITKYIYFMFYKSIYDINIEIKFTILAKQRNI